MVIRRVRGWLGRRPTKARASWKMAALGLAAPFCVTTAATAQTPEQTWAEWSPVEVDAAELIARRESMLEALRRAGGGTLLVPSGGGLSEGETFRQDDDFWYLVGLELPRSLLVVDSESGVRLFVPERDFRFENRSRRNDFPGRVLASDPTLRVRAGLERIEGAQGLEAFLAELAAGVRPVWVHADPEPEPPGLFSPPPTAPQRLVDLWRHRWPSRGLRDAAPLFAQTRGLKTATEVALMRDVTELTVRAIVAAVSEVRAGVTERDLEAAFEAACKRGGSQRIPFHPIIKSGPHSLWPWRVLASHYDRRNRALHDGELVIFDVGCELNRYQSDVGRTFPVSGTFTTAQRTILEMEVAVADRIIEAIRPGVTFAELREVAYAAIPDTEEAYMQVGLFFGHAIGMSMGDPFDEEAPLQPGTVFTVEPWYYNHATGISVFTEDVVLVTERGVEVLSADLPRRPAELEALMRGGRP